VNFLLYTIVVVLALLTLLLVVPIELSFNINRTTQTQGQIDVRWFFSLIRFRIDIPGDSSSKKNIKKKSKRNARIKHEARKSEGNPARFFRLLKQSAFRSRLFKFIKDVLHATHLHDLNLRMRIGLGDPADTGRAWALLGPLATMASNIRSAAIRIEPEFMDSVFEVHSHGRLRLVPFEFIVLTIAFALSPPSLRAWRSMRQA